MSKIGSKVITCLNCGEKFDVTVYESVNVSLSPELKEELFSGKLNCGKCPKCGTNYALDIPFLYHDMDRYIMVFVYPDDVKGDREELKNDILHKNNYFEQYQRMNEEKGNPCHVDVVFGLEELKNVLNKYENMTMDNSSKSNDYLRCSYCKKEIDADSKFCEFCGNKIVSREIADEMLDFVEKSKDAIENEKHTNRLHALNEKMWYRLLKVVFVLFYVLIVVLIFWNAFDYVEIFRNLILFVIGMEIIRRSFYYVYFGTIRPK